MTTRTGVRPTSSWPTSLRGEANWTRHVMNPSLRGERVTVWADGNIIDSLGGGQTPPSHGHRLRDSRTTTIFSVNIEMALCTTNVEDTNERREGEPFDPGAGSWLWYLGMPLSAQAKIYPGDIEDDFIGDLTWGASASDFGPVSEHTPANKSRRGTWWTATGGTVSALLTIEGRADGDAQAVDVADWFYHPNHGGLEPGLQNFSVAPIGAMASQITQRSGWTLGLVQISSFASDTTVSLALRSPADSQLGDHSP